MTVPIWSKVALSGTMRSNLITSIAPSVIGDGRVLRWNRESLQWISSDGHHRTVRVYGDHFTGLYGVGGSHLIVDAEVNGNVMYNVILPMMLRDTVVNCHVLHDKSRVAHL
jgi:hypothetical protein